MPTETLDPERQAIYDELNRRGAFRDDPVKQAIGHELRRRGVVADATQGGLVTPASPPQEDFGGGDFGGIDVIPSHKQGGAAGVDFSPAAIAQEKKRGQLYSSTLGLSNEQFAQMQANAQQGIPVRPVGDGVPGFLQNLVRSAALAPVGLAMAPIQGVSAALTGASSVLDQAVAQNKVQNSKGSAASKKELSDARARGGASSKQISDLVKGLIPFSGPAQKAIQGGPVAGLEEIGRQAYEDPAGLALQALATVGIGHGIAKGIGSLRPSGEYVPPETIAPPGHAPFATKRPLALPAPSPLALPEPQVPRGSRPITAQGPVPQQGPFVGGLPSLVQPAPIGAELANPPTLPALPAPRGTRVRTTGGPFPSLGPIASPAELPRPAFMDPAEFARRIQGGEVAPPRPQAPIAPPESLAQPHAPAVAPEALPDTKAPVSVPRPTKVPAVVKKATAPIVKAGPGSWGPGEFEKASTATTRQLQKAGIDTSEAEAMMQNPPPYEPPYDARSSKAAVRRRDQYVIWVDSVTQALKDAKPGKTPAVDAPVAAPESVAQAVEVPKPVEVPPAPKPAPAVKRNASAVSGGPAPGRPVVEEKTTAGAEAPPLQKPPAQTLEAKAAPEPLTKEERNTYGVLRNKATLSDSQEAKLLDLRTRDEAYKAATQEKFAPIGPNEGFDPARGNPSNRSPLSSAPRIAGGAPGTSVPPWWKRTMDSISDSIAKMPRPDTGEMVSNIRNAGTGSLSNMKRMGSTRTTLMARELEGAEGRAAVIANDIFPEMARVGGGPENVRKAFMVLTESRLQGARNRWNRYADEVQAADPEDLMIRQKSGNTERIILDPKHEALLEALQDSPAQQAARTGTRKGWDYLTRVKRAAAKDNGPLVRQLLTKAYREAADRVPTVPGTMLGGKNLLDQGFVKSKEFQAIHELYRRHIEPELMRSHAENDGVFSKDLGPLNTVFPLRGTMASGEVPEGRGVPRPAEFGIPRNQHSRFTTGQADSYAQSHDPLRIKEGLTEAFERNSRAGLIKSLQSDGLLVDQKDPSVIFKDVKGEDGVTVWNKPYMTVRGKQVEASLVPTSFSTKGYVPSSVARELAPILTKRDSAFGKGQMVVNALRPVFKAGNTIGVAGTVEVAAHSTNLIGTLTQDLPFLEGSLGKKAAGLSPLTKKLAIMDSLWNVDPAGNAFTHNLRDAARLGNIPARYGDVTVDPVTAQLTGAKEVGKVFGKPTKVSTGAFLFGPKGLDVRARIMEHRGAMIMEGLDPNAEIPKNRDGSFKDPEQALRIAEYADHLGQYNRGLMPEAVRVARDTMVGPFAVAGNAMTRNGIRAWLDPLGKNLPMREGLLSGRRQAYNLGAKLTGGAVGLVATWAMLEKARHGVWPWQDKKSRFLEVRLTDQERRFPGIKQTFGDAGDAYVSLGAFDPIPFRGASALGIRGSYNARQAGASPGLAFEAGMKDAINTNIHPYVNGPVTAAALGAGYHVKPYFTGYRDKMTGREGGEFLTSTETRKPGALNFALSSLEGAASGISSMYDTAAGFAGIGEAGGYEEMAKRTKAGAVVKRIVDVVLPGAIRNVNTGKAIKGYRRQNRLKNNR